MSELRDVIPSVFAIFCCAVLVFALVAGVVLLGRIAPKAQAQEHKQDPKAKTLEERVAALEKENTKLRARLDSKLQRGNYRMSEIEADIREGKEKDEEQDRRLALGKRRMREIEECYAALLDRVVRHHPKEGSK
jgi:hypothetical protein